VAGTGTVRRRHRRADRQETGRKEILPAWSGELLDNIIDYVTYVLIPAFALYQRGFMGERLSFLSTAIIIVSSAIYAVPA
jgi:phosphatidylserine synthase